VKKIPKHVLERCEYGKDDYSLNIQNLPQAEKEEKQSTLFEEEV
jgi:adenine-specific DNA-methyltransferase